MWCVGHALMFAARRSASKFLGHGLGCLTRSFDIACIKRPRRPTQMGAVIVVSRP